MKPPPPIFPAAGNTTARANCTAIAASIALPPFCIMSTPTWLARGCADTTIAESAIRPRTGSFLAGVWHPTKTITTIVSESVSIFCPKSRVLYFILLWFNMPTAQLTFVHKTLRRLHFVHTLGKVIGVDKGSDFETWNIVRLCGDKYRISKLNHSE